MFIPAPWSFLVRPALYVAVVLAAFALGWSKGSGSVQDKWTLANLQADLDVKRRLIAVGAIETRVVYQYMDRFHIIEKAARIIEKEVPKYVTREADERCTVNRGFVWLHDAAVREAGSLPGAAGPVAEEPSGVTLSRVAEVVTGNYERYHKVVTQCEALQHWVREVAKR